MAMPTTRRGRFLFFKARAIRRMKRVHAKHFSNNPLFDYGGHRSMCRTYDVSDYEKQVPRDADLPPTIAHRPPYPLTAWRVQPSRDHWGVIEVPPGTSDSPSGTYHRSEAFVGYHERRRKSIPRLKHLDLLPYPDPPVEVHWRDRYPFEFYPSGQANPHFPPGP